MAWRERRKLTSELINSSGESGRGVQEPGTGGDLCPEFKTVAVASATRSRALDRHHRLFHQQVISHYRVQAPQKNVTGEDDW